MPRPGEVVVSLLGKPTLNGAELCSDADDLFADAQYWCKDTYARDLGSVGPLITGREEVDVVRGVLAELRNLVPARTL